MKTITYTFEKKIDLLIFQSIKEGKYLFQDLLSSVPGAYPTEILDSVKRLTNSQEIPPKILKNLLMFLSSSPTYDIESDVLPSHPLDFTWHFSKSTRMFLLDYMYEMTRQHDSISFLGTPSLLCEPHPVFLDRTPYLIDKQVSNFKTRGIFNLRAYRCDLLRDIVPTLKTNLVIADPPWYSEYYNSFLWAASKMCSIGGKMFLVLPAENIRPEMPSELKQIIRYSKSLGFSLSSVEKNVISYNTPEFERNSLISKGISNFPKDWRKADLGIFIKKENRNISRKILESNDSWKSVTINGIEIRIKINKINDYVSPSLISIVQKDVLGSVSRRDPIRNNVNVWFEDNRVFFSQGPNILYVILQAMEGKKYEIGFVSNYIKRKLKQNEIIEIKSTIEQIKKLTEQ